MKSITILVNKQIVHQNIFIAETFFERLKGLMFINKNNSFGILFKNCNSIHSCFMKFNLDIYCLDKNYRVIKIYNDLKPFRFVLPSFKTKHILELPNNTNNKITLNDIIEVI